MKDCLKIRKEVVDAIKREQRAREKFYDSVSALDSFCCSSDVDEEELERLIHERDYANREFHEATEQLVELVRKSDAIASLELTRIRSKGKNDDDEEEKVNL